MHIRIKEKSWLAKLASKKLRTQKVAMVLGQTIHLYNASKEDFLNNPKWLRHEVAHVKQFQQLGWFKFTVMYLLESFNKGYYHNKFEVEARSKENDASILAGVIIQ
jgi:hypothetical protein